MFIPAIPLTKAAVLAGAAWIAYRKIGPHSFSQEEADRLGNVPPGLQASLRGPDRIHGSGRWYRRYRVTGFRRWLEIDAAAIFQVKVRMPGGERA